MQGDGYEFPVGSAVLLLLCTACQIFLILFSDFAGCTIISFSTAKLLES
jgi:hypothetical protein